MYTEKISLIDDDADDAGAAAAVPDWEMSEEFLDHAKARHLLFNDHTTIVTHGCTCHELLNAA